MLKIFLQIFKFLSPKERRTVISLALVRSAASLLDLIAIILLATAVTVASGGKEPEFLGDVLPSKDNFALAVLVLASAVLFVSKTTIGLLLARVSTRYLAKLEVHHSDEIARKIFSGDLASIKKYSRPEIEWAVLRSTENMLGVVGQLMNFTAELTLAATIITLFFLTDPTAAFFIILYLSLFLLAFHLFTMDRFKLAGANVTVGSVSFSDGLRDLVSAYREIEVIGATPFYLERLREARKDVAFGRASDQFISSVPRLLLETGLILGALVFVLIEFARFDADYDFSTTAVFLAGSLRLMSAFLPLQRSISAVLFLKEPSQLALSFLENAGQSQRERIALTPANDLSQSIASHGSQPLGIVATGVSFRYTIDSDPVLHDISMVVNPGSLVALVGPSGAGKSTLADLLIGLQRPLRGEILVEGVGAWDARTSQPGLFGYVPQNPGIVTGSILSNVALGVPDGAVNYERLHEALELAHLSDLVAHLEDGVNTDIGKQLDNLSGGQLQRIGIARALYFSPKLLVLDEATSALDSETEEAVSGAVQNLRDICTVVVIAHRLSTVKNADEIFVFDAGRLVDSGTFVDLRKKSPIMQSFITLSSLD